MGGGVRAGVLKHTQKPKNAFKIANSLQGKLKIQDVEQKQKVVPKMLKFANLEGSISDH